MLSPRILPAFLCTAAFLAADDTPDGWFEWPYVDAVSGSALDTSSLNHKPAGSLGRVVVRDGQFATTEGGRIRFWGTNLSAAEAFPDAEGAARTARRLAEGGINIARLHHLDNNWGVATRDSIWTPDNPRRIEVDAQQLDKLHRLVAELKAQGIYSNVNLKVSRTFSAADGFADTVTQLPAFQKRVDYFNRRMIDLQKDYARQLLAAKNPYTGLSLAEDPAVAVVEINNENSLLGMRTRDVGRDLHLLPEPFRGELAALWNTWLTAKYPDDKTLAAAWAEGATTIGAPVVTEESRWHADAQPGNTVDLLSDPADQSAIHFRVGPGDGVRWRSAAFLDRLVLENGKTYTLTFAARADSVRPAQVALGRDEPLWRTDKWRTLGLVATIPLKPEWTEFRFVINAHSIVDVGARLTFHGGHAQGDIWVKDLRVESGSSTAGLQPGQSAAGGSVPIPTDPTPAQWTDWLVFLSELEKRYVAGMIDYLRNDLGVTAPIACTQANYGGIAGLVREEESDFIDAHAYWQHPDFAGATGVWNLDAWTINNSSQIGEATPRRFGEFGALAQLRVSGKPFCLSELDIPAPSDFACEMYPVLATLAGVQDWDALYTFDMVGAGDEKADAPLGSFFDQMHHPAKWGFGPFAARVFRLGLVPRAESSRELFVKRPVWTQADHLDVLWLQLQPGQDIGFLSDRLTVSEAHADSTHIERRASDAPGPARIERTATGIVYLVNALRAATIVGYFGGAKVSEPGLGINCDAFGLNFGALTAVALDEGELNHSARVLVTLAARVGNTGAVWNEARTSTAGANWGRGPTIAERVPATVRIRVGGPRQVFALAPDGSRVTELAATFADGWLAFSTREGPATLHYEIVKPGSDAR
jgi:hypothetical protein